LVQEFKGVDEPRFSVTTCIIIRKDTTLCFATYKYKVHNCIYKQTLTHVITKRNIYPNTRSVVSQNPERITVSNIIIT